MFGALRAGTAGLLDDLRVILLHARIVCGVVLLVIGLLSFSSDRYCDGTTSAYYACTNPSAYYYYPWWTILLIVLGSILVTVWMLRQRVGS